jgi:hypothetical protein
MGPEVRPMSVAQAVVMAANGSASTDADGSRVGPGLLGFLVFAGLCAALIVLYRSLRRQLRRIDFDADGQSDAERMRRDGTTHDTTGDGPTP